jgi:hypothetical protein
VRRPEAVRRNSIPSSLANRHPKDSRSVDPEALLVRCCFSREQRWAELADEDGAMPTYSNVAPSRLTQPVAGTLGGVCRKYQP